MIPDMYGSEYRKQQTGKCVKHRPVMPCLMVCAVPGDMQFQPRIDCQDEKRHQC